MPFKTPEEFFLGETTEPATKLFDPMLYVKSEEEPGMLSLSIEEVIPKIKQMANS
jgi:hypothetical protein